MIEGICHLLPDMVERLVMENEAWGEQFLNTLREEHPDILQRVQTLVPNLFPGNNFQRASRKIPFAVSKFM